MIINWIDLWVSYCPNCLGFSILFLSMWCVTTSVKNPKDFGLTTNCNTTQSSNIVASVIVAAHFAMLGYGTAKGLDFMSTYLLLFMNCRIGERLAITFQPFNNLCVGLHIMSSIYKLWTLNISCPLQPFKTLSSKVFCLLLFSIIF